MANVDGYYVEGLEEVFYEDALTPLVDGYIAMNPGTLIVTQAYLMQAWDSVTNQQYDWLVVSPDWTGIYYPGPNSPVNIAVAGIVVQCP
jgi:hypothetical protein